MFKGLKSEISPVLYILVVVSALVVWIFPESILRAVPVSSILRFQASFIPKLGSDSALIAMRMGDTWAARYLLSYTVCTALFFPAILYCVPFAAQGIQIPRKKPLSFGVAKFFVRFSFLLAVLYFLFFDQLMPGSDDRTSKAIYGSPLFLLWIPVLFQSLANAMQLVALQLAHFWRTGSID